MNYCLACNKETSNKKYCSYSCAAKLTRNHLGHKKPLIDNICKNCNKAFKSKYYERIFCSKKCAFQYNNKIMALSEEIKKKQSLAKKGKTWEQIFTNRIKTGKYLNCSLCGKLFYRKKSHLLKNYGQKNKIYCTNKCRIQGLKDNGSWSKGLTCDTDERVKENHINIHKSCNRRPNKAENRLNHLLKKMFPKEWEYVGDGKVIIEGYNPDFININGEKRIIELFGDYWHKGQDPKDRISLFKKYGYSALIIWENELKNENKLIKRIKFFK